MRPSTVCLPLAALAVAQVASADDSGWYLGAGAGLADTADNDDEDALYGIGVRYAVNERLRLYLDATYFMEVGEADTGQANYLNFSAGARRRECPRKWTGVRGECVPGRREHGPGARRSSVHSRTLLLR